MNQGAVTSIPPKDDILSETTAQNSVPNIINNQGLESETHRDSAYSEFFSNDEIGGPPTPVNAPDNAPVLTPIQESSHSSLEHNTSSRGNPGVSASTHSAALHREPVVSQPVDEQFVVKPPIPTSIGSYVSEHNPNLDSRSISGTHPADEGVAAGAGDSYFASSGVPLASGASHTSNGGITVRSPLMINDNSVSGTHSIARGLSEPAAASVGMVAAMSDVHSGSSSTVKVPSVADISAAPSTVRSVSIASNNQAVLRSPTVSSVHGEMNKSLLNVPSGQVFSSGLDTRSKSVVSANSGVPSFAPSVGSSGKQASNHSNVTDDNEQTVAASVAGAPSVVLPPSVSGAPSVVLSPSVSGAPSVAKAPSVSGVPSLSKAPSVSGNPSVPKAPSSVLSATVPSNRSISGTLPQSSNAASGAYVATESHPTTVTLPPCDVLPSGGPSSLKDTSVISTSNHPSVSGPLSVNVPSASKGPSPSATSSTDPPTLRENPVAVPTKVGSSNGPSHSPSDQAIDTFSADRSLINSHITKMNSSAIQTTSGAPSIVDTKNAPSAFLPSKSPNPSGSFSGVEGSYKQQLTPADSNQPPSIGNANSLTSAPLNASLAGSSHGMAASGGKLSPGLSGRGGVSAVLNRDGPSYLSVPLTPTANNLPSKPDFSVTNSVCGDDVGIRGATSIGGVPVDTILGVPSNKSSVHSLLPATVTNTSIKNVSKVSLPSKENISRRGSRAASLLASGSKEGPTNDLLSAPSKIVGSRSLAASMLASGSSSALRLGSSNLVPKSPSAARSLNGEEEEVEAFRKCVSRSPSRPRSRLSGSMVQSSNLKVPVGSILNASSAHTSQSLATTPAVPSSRPRSLVHSSSIGSQNHISAGSNSPLLATSQAHLSTVSTNSPSYAGSLHHLSVPGVVHSSVSGKASSKEHLSQSIIKDRTSTSLGKSAVLSPSGNMKSLGKGSVNQLSAAHSKLSTSVNKFSESTSKSATALGATSVPALKMKKKRVSKEDTIIINIKTISGRLIPVEVKPSDTIYQLKSIIQVVEGTPIPLQKLLVKSRKISRSFSEGGRKSDDYIINQLQDPRTVSSYDLHDGTSIRLFQKFSTPTASAASVKVKQPAPVKAQLTNPLSIIKSRAASFSSYRSSNRAGATGSNTGGASSVMSEELVPKKKLRPIQPSPDPSVHVFLKTLEDRKFVMNLKPTDTVYDVKSIVKKMQGVLIADQKLVYKGKVLPDSEKISNIKMNDSTLHLVTRSRRGPPPEGLE
ncbi:unnamed protein product [Ambrosiozyma monospora]|uniref:Unnamed protein product n=1 Tax=Ambrosiozyma monospora TaxID=43982 RepID=A0ACB5SRA4_AMBMO|nr:unnamed protein product [Ambrosiozyma monospora]